MNVKEFIKKLKESPTMRRGRLDQNLWWKKINDEIDIILDRKKQYCKHCNQEIKFVKLDM